MFFNKCVVFISAGQVYNLYFVSVPLFSVGGQEWASDSALSSRQNAGIGENVNSYPIFIF